MKTGRIGAFGVGAAAALQLFGFGLAGPAMAQSEDTAAQHQRPAEFETIYTSARQRKGETLQDTPVVANILTADMLERYALDDLEQVAIYTPNLLISYGSSGGSANLFLRGIGTGSGSAGFDSAIGIVIDGVYYSRGRYVQQGFFDLDQIEVLKGPQALYFGKNNSAGLIVMRTRNPGDEFEAHVKAGYEFEAEQVMAEAAVSVPLSDQFGVRVAFKWFDMNGWMKNLTEPLSLGSPLFYDPPGSVYSKFPHEKEYQGRVTFRWTPNDDLEAIFKVSAVRNEDAGVVSRTQLVQCFGPGGTPQSIFGVPSIYDDCTLNYKNSKSDIPPGLVASEPDVIARTGGVPFTEYEALTLSLQINYELENVTLSSVTGFQHYDVQSLENYTFSDDGQVPGYEATDYDAFSQELRLVTKFDAPVNFMLGVLYTDSDLYFRNSSRVAPFQFFGVQYDPATGRQWTWDKHADTKGKSWSVYGEVVWNIIDTLELAGGARYTKETKKSQIVPDYLHCGADVTINCAGIAFISPMSFADNFKDDNVSPQVTLTWRPTDEWTVYGAYKTGFKSGGFDSSFLLGAGSTLDDLTFDSEKAHGFEVGAKASLMDRTLIMNSAVYSYLFKDLQVQQYNAETTQFTIDNAARARTTGVEIDVNWLATDALTLRGSVSYNRAKYKEFLASCFAGMTQEQGCTEAPNPNTGVPTSVDVSGDQLAFAPEWIVKGGFSYDFLVANGINATVGVDGTYTSAYPVSLALAHADVPYSKMESFFLLDANLRLFDMGDSWEVSIIGRNLTNKKVGILASDRPLTGGAGGLPESNPASGQRSDLYWRIQRGRQIWLQVTFRFQ